MGGEHDYLFPFFSTELTTNAQATSSYISAHNKCALHRWVTVGAQCTSYSCQKRCQCSKNEWMSARGNVRVSSILHSSWRSQSQKCNGEYKAQYSAVCICLNPMVYISTHFQLNKPLVSYIFVETFRRNVSGAPWESRVNQTYCTFKFPNRFFTSISARSGY